MDYAIVFGGMFAAFCIACWACGKDYNEDE